MGKTEDPGDNGRKPGLPEDVLARIGGRLRSHFSEAVIQPMPQRFEALLDALARPEDAPGSAPGGDAESGDARSEDGGSEDGGSEDGGSENDDTA
jgi:hypothetical protein